MNNVLHRVLTICFLLGLALTTFGQVDTVIFSDRGGFYETAFLLELSNSYPQNHIRYTTNGNRPTSNSPLYSEALVLDESLYSKSDIYTIVTCPEGDFFRPDSVGHCIVIRAAVFDENDSCISKVVTNSYFIHDIGCDTHGLPAVSLCADSLDLFGYETGIMVPGVNFNPLYPYLSGNYFMKGREWERLTNMEFYELDDNSGINQQLGLRTHGKQSRWRSQKGFALYAREEYGKKRIHYKFFETTQIASFKHLTLRPYMSSWNGSGCKDYLCNRIVEPLDVESLSSRPCVLFINGEYWGIYYVEEKPDEHYLDDHLDVNKDNVTIIKEWNEVDCGDPTHFNALYSWMEQADLSDDEQYAYAEAHIDLSSFIDYFIFEIFAENLDWPATNLRCWQEGDGPWRWIFYDGDGCLEEQGLDAFANATYVGDDTWPSSRRATLFFRKLLENETFKIRFSSRFNELAITVFDYQNTKPYFDYIKQLLSEAVPSQIERFNSPSSYTTWENYCMAVIDYFLQERPYMIIRELDSFLSLEDTLPQELHIYPNPANNVLFVETRLITSPPTTYRITNLMGQTLLQGNISADRQQINVESLPTGMYFITIGDATQKFVVR